MLNSKERGNVFLGLLLLAGVLLFIIWYINADFAFFKDQPEDDPDFEAKMIAAGKFWQIEITNKGFVPENVKLKQYDTLVFTNKDLVVHEIVDIDENCPTVNSNRALVPNEIFSVRFAEEGVCEYAEAKNDDWSGVITIEKLTKAEKEKRLKE